MSRPTKPVTFLFFFKSWRLRVCIFRPTCLQFPLPEDNRLNPGFLSHIAANAIVCLKALLRLFQLVTLWCSALGRRRWRWRSTFQTVVGAGNGHQSNIHSDFLIDGKFWKFTESETVAFPLLMRKFVCDVPQCRKEWVWFYFNWTGTKKQPKMRRTLIMTEKNKNAAGEKSQEKYIEK